MTIEDFELILDECIDRINRGDSLADCLSDYPSHAEKLKALLNSMFCAREAHSFIPSADSKRAARQKFYAALDRRRTVGPASLWVKLIRQPAIWTTVAVLVLAIITTQVMRPALSPTLISSPEGNFALLISDEPNDIDDFENLMVTISRVGLHAETSGKWIEFTPEIKTVDLVKLQGEVFQEIWRGDAPPGQYSQVFIYVSEVKGKLGSTGQTIQIKLTSNKLHLSVPFEIAPDTVTKFTFDITVMATGNKGKYILKPQVGESGAEQEPKPVEN